MPQLIVPRPVSPARSPSANIQNDGNVIEHTDDNTVKELVVEYSARCTLSMERVALNRVLSLWRNDRSTYFRYRTSHCLVLKVELHASILLRQDSCASC